MAKHHILIQQEFNAPIDQVFNALTDHEGFGKILKTKIERITDSEGENKNGIGSVRRITPLPIAVFEETVVSFEANKLMEYTISKGSPIKNHLGRMEFSEADGKTKLHYTIDFEPKLPIPFLGSLLKKAIAGPIEKSLQVFAKNL